MTSLIIATHKGPFQARLKHSDVSIRNHRFTMLYGSVARHAVTSSSSPSLVALIYHQLSSSITSSAFHTWPKSSATSLVTSSQDSFLFATVLLSSILHLLVLQRLGQSKLSPRVSEIPPCPKCYKRPTVETVLIQVTRLGALSKQCGQALVYLLSIGPVDILSRETIHTSSRNLPRLQDSFTFSLSTFTPIRTLEQVAESLPLRI